MDDKLVGWGRAVKARRRFQPGSALPPLWLFTDPARMPDVVAAVARLPKGLCGVVFRHDGAAGRAEMIQAVWRVCRRRRLALVVAGAGPLPAGAGRHRRGAAGPGGTALSTASAHSMADLTRARRGGAAAAFLSPVFPTASHPGAAVLGPWQWARMTRRSGLPVLALGGIDGRTVRRLPRWVAGAGAIGALLGG